MTMLLKIELKVLCLKYIVCWTAAINRCDDNHSGLSEQWKIWCIFNDSLCNQAFCNVFKTIEIICKNADHICEKKKQLSVHNVKHTVFERECSASWINYTFMTDCCITTWSALQKWVTVSKSDGLIWTDGGIVNLSGPHIRASEKLCPNNRLWSWHWTESAQVLALRNSSI